MPVAPPPPNASPPAPRPASTPAAPAEALALADAAIRRAPCAAGFAARARALRLLGDRPGALAALDALFARRRRIPRRRMTRARCCWPRPAEIEEARVGFATRAAKRSRLRPRPFRARHARSRRPRPTRRYGGAGGLRRAARRFAAAVPALRARQGLRRCRRLRPRLRGGRGGRAPARFARCAKPAICAGSPQAAPGAAAAAGGGDGGPKRRFSCSACRDPARRWSSRSWRATPTGPRARRDRAFAGPRSAQARRGGWPPPISRIGRTRRANARRVVDKSLGNFLHIGALRRALPNAKLVHVRRDPQDVCLSIFFSLFSRDMPLPADLAGLGRYHRGYAALMAQWRAALGPALHEVSYERLVADCEGETRALLAFCGLPLDARCLAFHADAAAGARLRRWRRCAARCMPAPSAARPATRRCWGRCARRWAARRDDG